jgi:hypothetical protein
LALKVTTSHNNTADAGCIVGGYDSANPARIYIGGPCSAYNNGNLSASFRWVVMQTVDAKLTDAGGKPADMTPYTGTDDSFYYSTEVANSHAEVGVGAKFHASAAAYTNAAMFMSTTSYLAKANFQYNKNSFIVDKTGPKKSERRVHYAVQWCMHHLPHYQEHRNKGYVQIFHFGRCLQSQQCND